MLRTFITGMTLSLGTSLIGGVVKYTYAVSVINGSIICGLLVVIGLSIWILRYPQPSTEGLFLLFWSILGLVLGTGL
jgi:hypothetical protein